MVFLPSAVMSEGEAYAGPSPLHFHSSLPVFISRVTTWPLSLVPRWAIHLFSTISGDMPVKNCGTAFSVFSFLQITFPVAASKHDSTPAAPKVTTLSPETAGVLRGPGWEPAGPVTAGEGY